MSSWDEEGRNFWRDSFKGDADTAQDEPSTSRALGRGKGATSNNRAFQALVSASYFFTENDLRQASDVADKVRTAAGAMILKYFNRPLKDLRGHGENRENPMTDAQLLLSLALATNPVTERTTGVTVSRSARNQLENRLRKQSGIVAEQLDSDGVKVHKSAHPHHFLTLHTVRALDAAARSVALPNRDGVQLDAVVDYGTLLSRVRDEIVQQLGLHLLPAPGFDSSSLVSCCALLSRFTGDADSPLLQQAVDALVADQSERGTWTTAGVLSFGRRRLVYIPSIELSLILVHLVLRDLHDGDIDLFDRARPALDASLRLVQSSYSRHGSESGWRNDRTRSGYEVESWTTAVVVQFLIAYREALSMAAQERVLRKYKAVREPVTFASFWADLKWIMPPIEQQRTISTGKLPDDRLTAFESLVDPTEDNTLVSGVVNEILKPTLTSVCQRPVETASFLLFGPPGTRKTTFVEELAGALHWPLMTLSPPVFLRNGLEGFEAVADEIFEDLVHLKRVVVLFDECEDFFRWRPSSVPIESRTIGAFITSGMLPRLQRLRQQRWIAFVINTNVEAFELDDAVTRRGRLDKAERVGHPELGAQLRYLERWPHRQNGQRLSSEHLLWFRRLLAQVDEEMRPVRDRLNIARQEAQRDNPDRGQKYRTVMAALDQRAARELTKVVTFSALDNLAERCVGLGTQSRITGEDDLRHNLLQEFERFGPDSFTPKRRASHSVLESNRPVVDVTEPASPA